MQRYTLMIIARVDWKRDGFVAGSSTFVEDWKLWSHVREGQLIYTRTYLERVGDVPRQSEVVAE